MGCDWYRFTVKEGDGILVPMITVLAAWAANNPELSESLNQEKGLHDYEKYDEVCKWVETRVTDPIDIQVLERQFIFLAQAGGLRTIFDVNVPGPYTIESLPVTLQLRGPIDAEDTCRLMKAARSIIPTESEFMLRAGKWMVFSSCKLILESLERSTKAERGCMSNESKVADEDQTATARESQEPEKKEDEDLHQGNDEDNADVRDVKLATTLPEHPTLADSRFFDVTFKVGKPIAVIGCNKASLAASNLMFRDMFLGNLQSDSEIVYEGFDEDAFRLVLTFILVDSRERNIIMSALENADEGKLSKVIEVAGFVGEMALADVCREYCIQTKLKDAAKVLDTVSFDVRDSEWTCFDMER